MGFNVSPKGTNGLYGWPVLLTVSDLEETLEKEPNNEPAKANRVPVPGRRHRAVPGERGYRLLRVHSQKRGNG